MTTCMFNEEELDKEWLKLLLEAKNLGMTMEEIRKFLLASL
ncbi:anti-repressor SinI family protein [Niallia nealsonii]